jgi:internalin A
VDGLNIEKLGLKDITDIKYLICLEDLFLSNNKRIKDYKVLSFLLKLKHLSLDNNNLTDISFHKYITKNIISLSLMNNGIVDISCLAGFTKLEWLFLSNNEITSLKGLESLEKLEDLSIDGNLITLDDLKYIEKICYKEVLRKLYIDRKVFGEYGKRFALYPEYLQWIDRIYFYEDDGSVTEWRNK